MSICSGVLATVVAAAATTPTTSSSLEPNTAQLGLAAILLIVALVIAFIAGTFRTDSVLGPLRLDETDSPLRVLAVAFLGFSFSLGLGGMYLALVHGKEIVDARQRNLEFVLPMRESVLVNVAALALTLIAVLRADQFLIRDGLRKLGLLPRDLARGARAGLFGAAVAIPMTLAMSIFVTKLWFALKFRPPESHEMIRLLFDDSHASTRWLVIISAVVMAPLFEETIFRGHLQTLIAHTIRRYRGLANPLQPIEQSDAVWIRWVAICTSAVLFALIHQQGWMMPPLFVLACCFGYVYERTGKLWAPILMHALFNATSIALALFARV